jgi:hypothetical protein
VFRLRSALVLLCGLALLATACSSDNTKVLNLAKAASSIRALAVRAYGSEAEIGGVKCPKQVAPQRGSVFTCTVAIDGQPLLIGVSQKDNKGNVRINQAQAVIFTKKAEEAVASFAAQGGSPTSSVSCGVHTVATRSPGEYFSCSVEYVDGTTGIARLQVKDTNGKVGIQKLKHT